MCPLRDAAPTARSRGASGGVRVHACRTNYATQTGFQLFSNGEGAKLKVFIYVHNFFNLIYVIILTCIFTGGLVDTGDFVLKRDLFQTYNKQTTIICRQTHTHTHTKSNIKPK